MSPTRFPVDLGLLDAEEYRPIQTFKDALVPDSVRGMMFYAEVVLGWMCPTVEVFSRRDQGLRYLTPFRLTLGVVSLSIYLALFGGVDTTKFSEAWAVREYLTPQQLLSAFPSNALVLGAFFVVYLVVGGYRLFDVYYTTHFTNVIRDTRHMGVVWPLSLLVGRRPGPLALPPFTEEWLFAYGEPAMWFAISSVVTLLSLQYEGFYLLGQWLFLTSAALAGKNQIVYRRMVEVALNEADARIEMARRRVEENPAPASDSEATFTVVPMPRIRDRRLDARAARASDADLMQQFLQDDGHATPAVEAPSKKEEVTP